MTPAWTRETPAPGVVVWQPVRGFRYGAEAFWLLGFALESGTPRTAIDLGTGSGIMAFVLASLGVSVVGVDVREEWGDGWRRSVAESAVSPNLRVADVSAVDLPPADLVVMNPPFFPCADGPVSPDPWKAAARAEVQGTVGAFVTAGARLCAPGGRVCAVVPLSRLPDLVAAGPLAVRRQVVVGRRRVLVELAHGAADPVCDAIGARDKRIDDWYRRVGAYGPTPR